MSGEQARGDGWTAALHPDDADRVRGEWQEAAEAGRDSIVEYRFQRPDGSVSWIQGYASAVRDHHGTVVRWVGTCLDLTAQKEIEAKLQALADHDPLTGLLNRRRFNEDLEREVARVRRHGGSASVLVLDIDRFKLINDTLGHRAGDQVLRTVAELLRRRIRATDILARIGGDEFALIAANSHGQAPGSQLAHDLVRMIHSTLIATHKFVVTAKASIGVATITADTIASGEEVLIAADEAMYQAKRNGGNQIANAA
jgi:diguanylate cyclase (GGDEF)-like protein